MIYRVGGGRWFSASLLPALTLPKSSSCYPVTRRLSCNFLVRACVLDFGYDTGETKSSRTPGLGFWSGRHDQGGIDRAGHGGSPATFTPSRQPPETLFRSLAVPNRNLSRTSCGPMSNTRFGVCELCHVCSSTALAPVTLFGLS